MRKNFAEAPNRAPFYSERKYNNNWSKATGGLDYQEAYEQNAIGCHGKCSCFNSKLRSADKKHGKCHVFLTKALNCSI